MASHPDWYICWPPKCGHHSWQPNGDDKFQNGQTVANHIKLFPIFSCRCRYDCWPVVHAVIHGLLDPQIMALWCHFVWCLAIYWLFSITNQCSQSTCNKVRYIKVQLSSIICIRIIYRVLQKYVIIICIIWYFSFDRYFSVTRPLTYRARRTTKRAALMIFSAWAISAVVWPPWIIAWPYIEGGRTVPPNECYIQFIYR